MIKHIIQLASAQPLRCCYQQGFQKEIIIDLVIDFVGQSLYNIQIRVL